MLGKPNAWKKRISTVSAMIAAMAPQNGQRKMVERHKQPRNEDDCETHASEAPNARAAILTHRRTP